uniref:2OG-Fe(II) oxygenase superfamily protein n=1 Tax=Pithovirus LCPAC406 TaxID=2506599 RepID=A0A481ZD91_9VIRU|nr:MAG: 2OG-Fe(II) oxygenase superfamily protein [Pithovirus LCPAC406]
MAECITITFGDVAENHVRMQKVGKMRERGFAIEELEKIKETFEEKGYTCELVKLHEALDGKIDEEATILIVRNGIEALLLDTDLTVDSFFEEQQACKWDTKAYMFGRVCNKKARYNVCFADESQEPDYENKKGRIISFDKVSHMKHIRKTLPKFLGSLAEDLSAEGNRYYDTSKCYIKFHGDAERKIVVGLRLGADFPLYFNWFQQCKPISDRITLNLSHGDVYIMSEKATGNDWRKRIIKTLRHAAGSEKNTKIKK